MLKVDNICIRKGGRDIFSDIYLNVKATDHILIKGASGSGKSTLLKSILMFEHLVAGSVQLHGKNVTVDNINEHRRDIAYIGQKAPHFDGAVGEFLKLPFSFKANLTLDFPSEDKIMKMIKLFSFDSLDILSRNYNSLSGGEQQRISIIQALLIDKPVYLLDEITASLDPANKKVVVNSFCRLKEKTLLIVSHDQEWESAVSRIVSFVDGQLVEVCDE